MVPQAARWKSSLAFALVLHAGSAAAATTAGPGFTFEVRRAQEAQACPDREALIEEVDRRLASFGNSPHAAVAEQVVVSIEREGDAYVATLSTVGPDAGTRRFADSSPDCAGLAEALSLMLAMIADGRPLPAAPAAAPAAPAPAPAAASLAPASSAPSSAPVSSVAKPATAPPQRPWHLDIGALTSSLLGSATLGYDVGFSWMVLRNLSIGAWGFWLPSRTIDHPPGTTEVSIEAGMARGCWRLPTLQARLLPAACAELGGGVLHGRGSGYAGSTSAARLWMAAGATANAEVRLSSRWSVAAQGGVLYPFRGQRFTIGGLGTVYESNHLAWLAGIDLRLRIW